MKIGVLAVQGAFIEHEAMLQRLGVSCIQVRQKTDLQGIDGIVLPGGESTVQGQLLHKLEIFEPLKAMIADGLPVLATCAGLILLAEHLDGDATTHLATLPVCVKRNAYGRQLSSFTATADVGDIADYPLVFIRAPYISAAGENVQTLAKVDGNIVAVRYQNQIGLAFHPELTDDTRIHASFLKLVEDRFSKQ
ncbi:MAG: pyridoxal 5'-phosphate synthase glutaminase subunit PdxT [Oscillospiraceae bacterium]|nr:pyridoxal 5'-phosphate synthase glutaminase subunit PdxT [Oscillospiraceae bacterium]